MRRLIEKGCQVVVAATETEFDPDTRRTFLNLPIKSFARNQVRDFDVIIANFGDHFPNHALSLEALPCARVIGVFHDADMINFGNGMQATGTALNNAPVAFSSGKKVVAAIARECAGAVAHSSFYLPIVGECGGPIDTIPLAWSLPKGTQTRTSSTAGKKPSSAGFALVTFGHINKNKCADRVIEAIAGNPKLRKAIEYRLVGAIEPSEHDRLSELADQLKVNLTIVGRVDDDQLHRELREAGIISCLREPVLEGASASAIEAMLHGCAVLVSDAGFYADLPDDCVAKVPQATDAASIQQVLEKLIAAPKHRAELGQRARDYAEDVFSPDRYANSLLELIRDVCTTSAYETTIESVAECMVGLGMKPGSASVDLIIRTLEDMAPVVRRGSTSDAEPAQ